MSRLPVVQADTLAAAGRGVPPRFLLELRWRDAPADAAGAEAGGAVALECLELLRLLPGRRLVARVRRGNGSEAVLKLFVGHGAARYWARERQGCEALRAAGVATPVLLGSVGAPAARGAASDAALGLLFEPVPDARPLGGGEQDGVEAAAAELARLHGAGYLHRDLHLDNFLRSGGRGRPQLVDGDGVRRAGRGRVGWRAGIDNLAVLCAQRPPLEDQGIEAVYRAYAEGRGWPSDRGDALVTATRRQRRARLRRYLAKAQRECTEFHCERSWHRYLAAVRDAWDDGLETFAADPEAVLAGAEVIKAGNSATVVRVRFGARSRVVKRYNVKGPWHALRRNLRRVPRFRLAWLNGQRLHMLGIPTARPLALVERRAGPWRGVAYLVMEDLGSRDLVTEISQSGLSDARLEQLVRIFQALDAAALEHGDTKASNFLVDQHRTYLVDLDAMVPRAGTRGRDLARFLANFEALPEVRQRLAAALRDAGLRVPPSAG